MLARRDRACWRAAGVRSVCVRARRPYPAAETEGLRRARRRQHLARRYRALRTAGTRSEGLASHPGDARCPRRQWRRRHEQRRADVLQLEDHGHVAGVAPGRAADVSDPAHGRRGQHLGRGARARRELRRRQSRHRRFGEPGAVPDVARWRPAADHPAHAEGADLARADRRRFEDDLLPRQRHRSRLVRDLPLEREGRRARARVRHAGTVVDRRSPRRSVADDQGARQHADRGLQLRRRAQAAVAAARPERSRGVRRRVRRQARPGARAHEQARRLPAAVLARGRQARRDHARAQARRVELRDRSAARADLLRRQRGRLSPAVRARREDDQAGGAAEVARHRSAHLRRGSRGAADSPRCR